MCNKGCASVIFNREQTSYGLEKKPFDAFSATVLGKTGAYVKSLLDIG